MRSLSFLAALTITACTNVPPPAPPTVLLHAERVSPDVIRLTLDNGASQPIGYNLCPSELQKRSVSGWVRVETGEVCTMEQRTLNPGHDATFEKRLPSNLTPGDYRYVASIENPLGTPQTLVATEPFTQ